MLQATGGASQQLPRLLLSAGGALQHARGLLALLGEPGAGGCSSGSGTDSSVPRDASGGRCISTTRGIYMGRVFIRENLQKSATKSSLFTRDNYQYLDKHGWSLTACEQVLRNHQASRRPPNTRSIVQQTLSRNTVATTSLSELQGIITRHAHQMSPINFAIAMQHVPKLLYTREGEPDFPAAALVLDQLAARLQPNLEALSGPNLCSCLAALVKCRYSPSAELLQALLQSLIADGGAKLKTTNTAGLAALLLALTRLVQPQGHWPIMQAVLEQTTQVLHELLAGQQRRALNVQRAQDSLQQHVAKLAGDGSAQAAAAPAAPPAPPQQQQQEDGGGPRRRPLTPYVQSNSMALLANLLARSNTSSPEYLAALHQWIAAPGSLAELQPLGVMQLWQAVRTQFVRHEHSAAAAAAAAAQQGEPHDGAEAAGSAPPPPDAAGEDELAALLGGAEGHDAALRAFFGDRTLPALAAATVPRFAGMSERELGQTLVALGRLRYSTPDLVAGAEAALAALHAAKALAPVTVSGVAWAAAHMGAFSPALLQPALLLAASEPGRLEGFLAARVLIATSLLPPDVLAQQGELLRAELHRRSGARGPAPAAAALPPAAGGAPLWVAALADSLAGRVAELRPRELAYVLLSYSQIAGVGVHEALFAAAAKHIEVHAHTFTQFRDMEMVASAFERLNFKDGLPALKALQQQTEVLVARQA